MSPDDLKQLRASLGLTQAALAERLSVHLQTVKKWESGEREISNITAAGIRALCGAPQP